MNKNELTAAVASAAEFTKADAGRAIDAVFDSITHALKKGDDVRLAGFGTFAVVVRKAKEGRNPRTGAKIQIPAGKSPKFKPGKPLKEAIC